MEASKIEFYCSYSGVSWHIGSIIRLGCVNTKSEMAKWMSELATRLLVLKTIRMFTPSQSDSKTERCDYCSVMSSQRTEGKAAMGAEDFVLNQSKSVISNTRSKNLIKSLAWSIEHVEIIPNCNHKSLLKSGYRFSKIGVLFGDVFLDVSQY